MIILKKGPAGINPGNMYLWDAYADEGAYKINDGTGDEVVVFVDLQKKMTWSIPFILWDRLSVNMASDRDVIINPITEVPKDFDSDMLLKVLAVVVNKEKFKDVK